MASPISAGAQFARVDQGVDYSQPDPYVAIGPGRVYAVTGGFAGGTGQAVYYKLDKPVLVGGRAYQELYVAETSPLVKAGQRVKEGQPVASGGAAELGFASGTSPAAPLVGGLGSGTQPSQEGYDFLALVKNGGDHVPTGHPSLSEPAPSANPQVPTPHPIVPGQAAPQAGPAGLGNDDLGILPVPESTQPQLLMPGSGGIVDQMTGGGAVTSRLWTLIQQEQNLSPDTLAYAQNVQLGG